MLMTEYVLLSVDDFFCCVGMSYHMRASPDVDIRFSLRGNNFYVILLNKTILLCISISYSYNICNFLSVISSETNVLIDQCNHCI